jgi:hypothetical protein
VGRKSKLKAKTKSEAAVMSLFDYDYPADQCRLFSYVRAAIESDEKKFPDDTNELLMDFMRQAFTEPSGHKLLKELGKMVEQGPYQDPERASIQWLSDCAHADTERGVYAPSKRDIAKQVAVLSGKEWVSKKRIVDKKGNVIQKATADDDLLDPIEKKIDFLKKLQPDKPNAES